jgi:hypothetical protein
LINQTERKKVLVSDGFFGSAALKTKRRTKTKSKRNNTNSHGLCYSTISIVLAKNRRILLRFAFLERERHAKAG